MDPREGREVHKWREKERSRVTGSYMVAAV